MDDISYNKFKAFVITMGKILFGEAKDPRNSPEYIISQLEAKSRSLAERSIVQGITDILSDTNSFDSNKVQEINAYLRSVGAETLSNVRFRYSSKYKSILKRGAISNEEEFFLIKSICEDANTLLDQERMQLLDILSKFERT